MSTKIKMVCYWLIGVIYNLAYTSGFAVSSMVKRQVQTDSVALRSFSRHRASLKNPRPRSRSINQNQYVSTIVGRSMFDSSLAGQQTSSSSEPADGDSVESSLQLTLLFTITATPEEYSVALIQNEEAGYASTYGVGYDLLGQATITKIESNRVYFQRNDSQQLEYIEVGQKAEPNKSPEKKQANASGDDGEIQKVGNNKYIVDQAVLDEILSNPETLPQVRVTPHKDANGDIDGYHDRNPAQITFTNSVSKMVTLFTGKWATVDQPSAAMDAYNSLEIHAHSTLISPAERTNKLLTTRFVSQSHTYFLIKESSLCCIFLIYCTLLNTLMLRPQFSHRKNNRTGLLASNTQPGR